MPNKSRKKSNSLKTKISNYILKKGDICCEEDYEMDKVIEEIFKLYKNIDSNYLDAINNDIVVFIGYFIDLKKNNDKEGMNLWLELESRMPKLNNKKKDEKNIKKLLNSIPLFYLLSFLGMAYYKHNLFK